MPSMNRWMSLRMKWRIELVESNHQSTALKTLS